MVDPDVCVIVRMYNEAPRVGAVVSGLLQHFAHVVCVDDGSTDDSGAIARAAGATVVRHAQNLGGGAALETGFELSAATPGPVGVSPSTPTASTGPRTRSRWFSAPVRRGSTSSWPRASRAPRTTSVDRRDPAVWDRLHPVDDATQRLRRAQRAEGLQPQRSRPRDSDARRHGLRQRDHRGHPASPVDLAEVPVTILYDDYSLAKGQSSLNAVNIIFDLTMARLRATS